MSPQAQEDTLASSRFFLPDDLQADIPGNDLATSA